MIKMIQFLSHSFNAMVKISSELSKLKLGKSLEKFVKASTKVKAVS